VLGPGLELELELAGVRFRRAVVFAASFCRRRVVVVAQLAAV